MGLTRRDSEAASYANRIDNMDSPFLPGKGLVELCATVIGLGSLGLVMGLGESAIRRNSIPDLGVVVDIVIGWTGWGLTLGAGISFFRLMNAIGLWTELFGLLLICKQMAVSSSDRGKAKETDQGKGSNLVRLNAPERELYLDGELFKDVSWFVWEVVRNQDWRQRTWDRAKLPSGKIMNRTDHEVYTGFLESVGALVEYGEGAPGRLAMTDADDIIELLKERTTDRPLTDRPDRAWSEQNQ